MKAEKHCESYGHGERVATHKRDGLLNKEHRVFMCYECSELGKAIQYPSVEDLNIRELKVPGHDDRENNP